MLYIVKEQIKIELVSILKHSEKQLMRIAPLRNSTTPIINNKFINNTACYSIQELCPSCHEHRGNLFEILFRGVNVRLRRAQNCSSHCSLINSEAAATNDVSGP